MRWLYGLALGSCGTEDTGAAPPCDLGEFDTGVGNSVTEEEELCLMQGESQWWVWACADGTIEGRCWADTYTNLACYAADGTQIGWIYPAGPIGPTDLVPYGNGTWCDCNGDGWPPSVEEYCALRGEAPP